jgi:multidrug efflux pump subunit AcrA (membrane-fusion protein)
MLDTFVTGQLTRAETEGFVVPRDAALPDEDGGYAVFTVKGDHAVHHTVRLGLQEGQRVQIISDELKVGDQIVVRGNYPLEDGAEVKVTAVATQPAPEPATSQPEAKQ